MVEPITGESMIALSVGELFSIAAGIASIIVSVATVYLAGVRRAERMETRLVDLEDWLAEEWKGGERRKGGYKQIVESLRYEQIEGRGARRQRTGEHPRSRSHEDTRRQTLGPGHDTQT